MRRNGENCTLFFEQNAEPDAKSDFDGVPPLAASRGGLWPFGRVECDEAHSTFRHPVGILHGPSIALNRRDWRHLLTDHSKHLTENLTHT
jgi:hypothetical protein